MESYEQLEKNKVKGVPAKELLTNIISLIRFSTGLSDVLEPFNDLVNERFENWLKQQETQRHSSDTTRYSRATVMDGGSTGNAGAVSSENGNPVR